MALLEFHPDFLRMESYFPFLLAGPFLYFCQLWVTGWAILPMLITLKPIWPGAHYSQAMARTKPRSKSD